MLRADLLVVNHFRGPAEAGVYSVASQFGLLLMLLPGVIATLLFPRVTAEQDARGETTCLVTRYTTFIMFLCCLAAVPFSLLLPVLYGAAFTDATRLLLILLPGVYLMGLESVLVQHFNALGLPRAIPLYWVITLALNLDSRVCARAAVWRSGRCNRIDNQLRCDLRACRASLSHQHRTIFFRGIRAREFARMKVVLLALSGDLSRWHDKLVQLYPDCSIETISRAEFETGSHLKRLKSLRALRPDVLAIATERLPWQRGQNLFMVFGALAGAREVLMLDAHGGQLRRSRSNRIARCAGATQSRNTDGRKRHGAVAS